MGTTTRTRRFTRRINAAVILLALTGVGLALAAAGPAQASTTTPKPSTSSSTNSSPSKSPSGSTGESPDMPTADFAAATSHGQTRVIIRAADGQLDTVLARAQQRDATITRPLPVINGFAATLPAAAVATLQADPQVLALTPDTAGHMQTINPALGYDQTNTGSLDQISTLVGARAM